MNYGLDFIAIAEADPIAEVILHDGQMVEVIVDVGGECLRIAAADQPLQGLAGRLPKDLEGQLIGLYQRAFVAVGAIDEKVQVATCVGLVGLKGRVDRRGLTEAPGLLHELERPVAVPLGWGLCSASRWREKDREQTCDGCRWGHRDIHEGGTSITWNRFPRLARRHRPSRRCLQPWEQKKSPV